MKRALENFFFGGSLAGFICFVGGFTAMFLAPFVIAGVITAHKHRTMLEANGCQLRSEYETGKRVYCGKACFRPERMQIYECFDGTRYEIDGRYLAGVGESK